MQQSASAASAQQGGDEVAGRRTESPEVCKGLGQMRRQMELLGSAGVPAPESGVAEGLDAQPSPRHAEASSSSPEGKAFEKHDTRETITSPPQQRQPPYPREQHGAAVHSAGEERDAQMQGIHAPGLALPLSSLAWMRHGVEALMCGQGTQVNCVCGSVYARCEPEAACIHPI